MKKHIFALAASAGEQSKSALKELKTLGKWVVMGSITGSIVGLIGSLFALSLGWANSFRTQNGWVIWFLPVAGLAIVFLYHFFKNTNDTGTNMVIAAIHDHSTISYKMAPLIYVSTFLTHLCGGSSGREGAAIQLGGSVTNFLSDIPVFRFTSHDKHTNILCGMSAGFAALFGAPLAAAVFALEVTSVGIMQYSALVPCIISSFTAAFISKAFGIIPESFPVLSIPGFTPVSLAKFLLFGLVLGWLSVAFCKMLHAVEHLYKKRLSNKYLRIAVGGCIVLAMTAALGNRDFLGSGNAIIEEIFHTDSPAKWYTFLLKMVFTAATLGAGFKGGEIVPAFTIGASFGSLCAGLMGMPVTLCAACGMVGVFCGVTNSPIASLLIAFEMFGFEGMPYYLFTIAVSYALSGYYGLYHTQRIIYSKTHPEKINATAH